MSPTTGRVIAGRYNLVDPIGRGAMGVVWRARDSLLDRDVAIKEVFLNKAVGDDERENSYQRTMREARTAARLSHRGVVTVYDVAEDDGRPWIIMELVPSRSLEQVLASDGPLPPRRACQVGRQLLAALAAAHGAGVLHRDVKPSNVLLATESEADGERAVLTDFGIAQFATDPRLTQTGMVMGSPGFTAPERIRGGKATPASDLWSLGATLFAAVEGHAPYEKRGGAITTMSAIIDEDPPLASSGGPLAPLIGMLMSRDPATRPTAAAAAGMFAGVLPLLPEPPAPADSPTPVDSPVPPNLSAPVGSPAPVNLSAPGKLSVPEGRSAATVKSAAVKSTAPEDALPGGTAADAPPGGSTEEAGDAVAVGAAAGEPGPSAETAGDGAAPPGRATGGGATDRVITDGGATDRGAAGRGASDRGGVGTVATGKASTGQGSTGGGGGDLPLGADMLRGQPTAPPPPGPDGTGETIRLFMDPRSPAGRPPALPGSRDDPPTKPQPPWLQPESQPQPPSRPQPSWPQPPQPGAQPVPRPRRRGGRWGLLAIVVVVLAAVIGTVAALLPRSSTRGTGDAGSTGNATTPSDGSQPGAVKAIDNPLAAPPAGWSRLTVPASELGTAAGFRIGVPPGWTVRHSKLSTYIDAPSGGRYVQIDLTKHDRTDGLAEAEYVERSDSAKGLLPGYHRVSLQRATIQGNPGAFWSFTWVKSGGVTMRVNDLLFDTPTATTPQSFAVYLTSPAAGFLNSGSLPLFDRMLRTFQPLTGQPITS